MEVVFGIFMGTIMLGFAGTVFFIMITLVIVVIRGILNFLTGCFQEVKGD